jgi:hypothetical protein
METSRLSSLLLSILLILGLLQTLPAFGRTVPVIIAVDTSRSLTPAQLRATTETLVEALAGLPQDTPMGLLAFDDSPRWIRPAGSSPFEVLSALGELEPQGNFTLMHDAVFLALRDMPEGGIILLATDGRDENSATTIEDVATRCNDLGVRLVTVGSGRTIDEQTLRRLALLTTGSYAGQSGVEAASELTGRIRSVASELEAARPAPAGPSEPAGASPPPAATDAQPSALPQAARGERSGLPSWAISAGLLVLLFAVVLFSRRGRPAAPATAFCEHCGSELDADGACGHCRDSDTKEQLSEVAIADRDELREVYAETEAFSPLSFEERIEQTCVLEEQTVLVVREPGQGLRTYSIPKGRAISVGRDFKANTLAVPDPTLSTRHFRIVPWDGLIYLLDLGSTNGCLLNGRRTEIASIRPGDVLKAGQIEFAVKTRQQQLGLDTEAGPEPQG